MKFSAVRYFMTLVVLTTIYSCTNSPAGLKSGIWRATLKTKTATEIPFNFEVIDSAGKKHIEIINGEERFRVDEITTKDDSILIQMPLFESEIKTVMKNGHLYGKWIKHLGKEDVAMDFVAEPDASWRFFNTNTGSDAHPEGRWAVSFVSEDGKDTTHAVGEFKQDGSKVTGTFLTATGDYRFLEGSVSGNKLYLSCFDGAHAYLFTGELTDENTITNGKFYSGYSYVDNWTAKRDEHAMLPDAYSLTALKPGYDKISFSFPNLEKEEVSLSDPKFQNKVVIVQFFGSWCPNCMDETAYLAPFYEKYKNKGVEVVGLAYERSTDFERSKRNVRRLKDRFNVTYDMLITGYTNDKEEVAQSLPMLNKFVAFPTLAIIDKKGKVRNIHTGFTGPGTGDHYAEFVEEFEKTVEHLLNEK
ncbi:MAG TPA: TlpA disulfide reductase family protein [Sphingobacteriaceae bacterium]